MKLNMRRSNRPTFVDAPAWVGRPRDVNVNHVVLNSWNGRATQVLRPDGSGAVFWWHFDGLDEGPMCVLVCHLTDREAQIVADTHGLFGPLERVRATLTDRSALISVIARGQAEATLQQIPHDGTEPDFSEWLSAWAHAVPGMSARIGYAYESNIELLDAKISKSEAGLAGLGQLARERDQFLQNAAMRESRAALSTAAVAI